MTFRVRFSLLTATAILALTTGAAPAFAKTHHHKHSGTTAHKAPTKHIDLKSIDMVRASQEHLANLGFFAGTYDGRLSDATKSAINNFQKKNNLPVTGDLNIKTYDALVTQDFKQSHAAELVQGGDTALKAGTPPAPTWKLIDSQKIPMRYGDLKVDHDSKADNQRFTVLLNGQTVLSAEHQPGDLQISKIFELKNEDAIIFTSYRGEKDCTFKNTLVVFHSKGGNFSKHEFESCAPSSSVREAHGALFIRFAGTMNKDGYDNWDVWRYEMSRLVRL